MAKKIKVVLIDDHTVVRRGLRTYLESFPDIQIIGEAASGEALMEQVQTWLPDVAIMDLLMPGGMDGIEATKQMRRLSPHTQVVVLTAFTDEARVVAALRAGAIGYIRKDADPETLLTAVRSAARGQSMLDPAVASAVLQELVQSTSINELTEREMDVLYQLAHGRTNREISTNLMIGEETVKTHIANILSKMQMTHRTQAVVYALKQGLISLDELDL